MLCEIDVPELEQEHQKKVAQVQLDVNLVEQAEQLVDLAETKINMAVADQKEAEANVGKYQAEVVRWESELDRMTRWWPKRSSTARCSTKRRKQFESSKSAWEAAKAAVDARKAAKELRRSGPGKGQDRRDDGESATSMCPRPRSAAWPPCSSYTKITAPYDGVVTSRNANTGDYVESVAGDKTASGHLPMFVVAQTDVVRVFVEVPEQFARYVRAGTKAVVFARPSADWRSRPRSPARPGA